MPWRLFVVTDDGSGGFVHVIKPWGVGAHRWAAIATVFLTACGVAPGGPSGMALTAHVRFTIRAAPCCDGARIANAEVRVGNRLGVSDPDGETWISAPRGRITGSVAAAGFHTTEFDLVVNLAEGSLAVTLERTGRTADVLVRVFQYASADRPVADAAVHLDDHWVGPTRADGTMMVVVPMGREVTIRVIAPRFHTASAAGTVNGNGERWTFYLFADDGPAGSLRSQPGAAVVDQRWSVSHARLQSTANRQHQVGPGGRIANLKAWPPF
jgi:hypothetical protein